MNTIPQTVTPAAPAAPTLRLPCKPALQVSPRTPLPSLWQRLDPHRRQHLAQLLAELLRRSYLQAKP